MEFPPLTTWDQQDESHLRRLLLEHRARRARADLIEYVKHTTPQYKVYAFHRQVADALMAVERGEIRRLMISAPPRHGKTQLVSKRFPLWYLGRNPNTQIVHCGYGGTIAEDAGRDLRNLTYNDSHLDVFQNCTLLGDSTAVNKWHTTNGGIYIAAGIGGAITGRGFHLGIIDDPVKGREEAESDVMQRKTWAWYKSEFFSRRMGANNAIVAIGTRWHENDLFGKLLAQDVPGEHWTHLRFPAIDAEGNALCPDLIPLKELEISRLTDPREWQALYMGDPTPDVGVYFERSWLRRGVPPAVGTMKIYGASDYAVTDGAGDYTVHLTVGIDAIERMWVLDLWRKQTSPDKWIPPLLDMMRQWSPIRWAEESGQIEKSVGPFLLREQMRRKIYTQRVQFTSSRDKPTRARAIQGRVAMRGLWLPAAAPWADDAESELLKFPAGKNDDIVDTLSLIGRMIAGLERGVEPDMAAPSLTEGELTLNRLVELEEKRGLR